MPIVGVGLVGTVGVVVGAVGAKVDVAVGMTDGVAIGVVNSRWRWSVSEPVEVGASKKARYPVAG